jgi:hypothetical protein
LPQAGIWTFNSRRSQLLAWRPGAEGSLNAMNFHLARARDHRQKHRRAQKAQINPRRLFLPRDCANPGGTRMNATPYPLRPAQAEVHRTAHNQDLIEVPKRAQLDREV